MNYNRGGGAGLCPHQRRKQIYALGVGRVEGHSYFHPFIPPSLNSPIN